MPIPFADRLKHAWNAFRDRDPTQEYAYDLGPGYSSRPDRVRLRSGTEKSISAGLYTRIAIDVSSIPIRHIRLDKDDRYLGTIDSGLNNCLAVEANIDQSGQAFIQDVVLSMLDEGAVAIVAVDTTLNPAISTSWDIQTVRTAKIVEWHPYKVKLNLYNERSGMKEDIILPKKDVVIIENPLYSVMNEPNSTLKRLVSKLNLLDAIDNQSGSGKLDLIIQLPYVVKTPARREQAETRRRDIESQLAGSKYGIAYTDGTERITQLNRPVENNLMNQIEYLTNTLYGQLGLAEAIFDGTATEAVMLNYYARTIDPILRQVVSDISRKFLTKTARSQGQSIAYFKDPFALVPASQFGALADSLTRNAIFTSNEIRQVFGKKPSSDKEADTLRNKNLKPMGNTPPASNSEQGVTNNDQNL